jgi:hypothetical protein
MEPGIPTRTTKAVLSHLRKAGLSDKFFKALHWLPEDIAPRIDEYLKDLEGLPGTYDADSDNLNLHLKLCFIQILIGRNIHSVDSAIEHYQRGELD